LAAREGVADVSETGLTQYALKFCLYVSNDEEDDEKGGRTAQRRTRGVLQDMVQYTTPALPLTLLLVSSSTGMVRSWSSLRDDTTMVNVAEKESMGEWWRRSFNGEMRRRMETRSKGSREIHDGGCVNGPEGAESG